MKYNPFEEQKRIAQEKIDACETMKKPNTRRDRINFIIQKKGKRMSDIFSIMTDREVKQYFDAIYPIIKDKPDATSSDDAVQCIRCGCDVEHHFECLCGYDRAVFSEEDWKMDIEDHNWSDLKGLDEEFIANGYKIPNENKEKDYG